MSTLKVELGNYVRIRTGKLDANESSPDGAYPFFTCAREPLRIAKYSFDCECVLVAGNGDLNVKYYDGKFDAYQRTYVIESLDKSVLDVRYLFHFMDTYLESLRHLSIGGVIKYIKLGNLTEAKIPLPRIPEQHRIAAILDKADALRTKRREALAQLDRLAQSIFVEMFGDPEKPTGKYPQTTLGDLCRRVTDGTHQSPTWVAEGIPFLFISNIVNGGINFDTDKYISRETYEELTRRCPIEKGDVLYTTVGSYGNSAVVSGDEEFCFQRHIAHIKPDPAKLDSVFCAAMIESPGVRKQVDKVARGVAQKTVNLSDLKALKVLAPDLSVQRLFTQQIANLQRLKDQQLMGLAQSDDLFRAVQHRAFRGEL